MSRRLNFKIKGGEVREYYASNIFDFFNRFRKSNPQYGKLKPSNFEFIKFLEPIKTER